VDPADPCGRDAYAQGIGLALQLPEHRFAWPEALRPCVRLATVIAACAIVIVSARAQAPTSEQIDEGRQVYEEFCQTCHGRDMIASGVVTSDLRKFPKDDAKRFRDTVLDGKGPAMPPWRGKLSDADVDVLWAYVRGGP
jgi:mono/diheme cytochrome c family protein